METKADSIRSHLMELKQTKTRHPEILKSVKAYWKKELNNRLKLS